MRLNIRSKIFAMTDKHITESIAAAQMNYRTFSPYKNYCRGEKDVVVCGAGPTLNKYKPIEGALHIALNRALLYDKVSFDFIFAQDMEGIYMVQDELIAYKPDTCVKFLAQTSYMSVKTIPESLALKCNARRFLCDYYTYGSGFKSKPVVDIENRAIGGMPNVGMSVMQFALFMNPRRLYIVGCDMKGNHFAKGSQTEAEVQNEGKGLDKYWKDDNEKLLAKWQEIKEFAKVYYPDTEIISVNPVGLKGMFQDTYQD